jgi:hypothetical protein
MKNIVLISCVSKKQDVKSKAAELYISTLFRLCLQYAKKEKPDAIFILSAKYGLIALDDEIEPYDVTLNKMSVKERKAWADKVIGQLEIHTDSREDHFTILAGERYRQYLLPFIPHRKIPLKGLPIGKQLRRLKKLLRDD